MTKMDRFLAFFLSLLLLAAHGGAEHSQDDKLEILEDLEDWDIEDGYEADDSADSFWANERSTKVLVNVDSFGAVGDGISDDTEVNVYIIFRLCCREEK